MEFLLGDRPRRILDLGAGTGKLVDVLVPAGHDVVAVDPSAEMLAELTARHPEVQTEVGDSEHIPLEDDSVDAMVAGQAAHWFDVPEASVEIARVLRPGGVVGLIWNIRDESVPWVSALSDVLDTAEMHDAARDLDIATELASRLGATVDRREFAHVERQSIDQTVASIGTRSYVAVLSEADRAAFLERVAALLAEHPDTSGRDELAMAYRTYVYRLQISD